MDNQSSVHIGIPTSPRKHAPVIPNFPEQGHQNKNHLFLMEVLWWQKKSRYIRHINISSNIWKKMIQFLQIKIFHPGFQLKCTLTLKMMEMNTRNFGKVWEHHEDDGSGKKSTKERFKAEMKN